MVDIDEIIGKYYREGSDLWRVLHTHSECVARYALECAERRGIECDREFLYEAGMLHDIGIVGCDARGIYCAGNAPYICHGVIGADMLRREGLERHALVCERHTGSGLSIKNILDGGLPLPIRDMLPVSVEEELICYADKFYSKSGELERRKELDKVRRQMGSHGADVLARFEALHAKYGI